jgi:hypothetical protein
MGGRRVEIDPEKAATVRRAFDLYLEGRSLNVIARTLHTEGVPPPRANSRHRRKGWVDATVRVFRHNEKYVGIWRYKERQWVKVPGANRRVPRARPADEVLEQLPPELRIIDQDTWRAARRWGSGRANGTLKSPSGVSVSGELRRGSAA